MNFNQTPTRIGMAAKFTRTYSSSLCRSPTRCASLSQFSEALFFLLFMFLRLTRGGAASCVGVVTGLAFFIFFSSELPPPRLACVSARKFLELSACLIHAGASCINQTCLCRGLLFLFLRLPGAEAGNVTGQVEFWSETRLQTNKPVRIRRGACPSIGAPVTSPSDGEAGCWWCSSSSELHRQINVALL